MLTVTPPTLGCFGGAECVVLSKLSLPHKTRASKSLSEDVPTSGHERLLTATFCQQAFDRTNQTLQSLTSSKEVKLDGAMADIAKQLVEHGDTVPVHPLGF